MNGLLSIISSGSSLNKNQYSKLVTALQNHQSFSQKASHELDPTVSLIINYLNNTKSRYEGLLLLRAFLLQCPLEIIEQKGGLWITLSAKACIQDKNPATVNTAYDVIKIILEKSTDIPELTKSIVSSLLNKVMETFNLVPAQCHPAALNCLECCMKLYPGPCGSFRTHIDRFLFSFIDDVNPHIVRQAAKCLHLLQQVRGGNTHGLSQKALWSLLQSQVIMNLHQTLDQVFVNTAETCDRVNYNASEVETFNIKLPKLNLSAEPVVRAAQLSQRFCNLCQFLRVALSEPFPASKAIQGSKILSLISRGLAINCSILAKNAIVDNIALGSLLPDIHVALYQLLNTLISVLGTYLLPYASNICQLVLQTLKWTSSGRAVGLPRPYSELREHAYKTLELWCETTKYGSFVENVAEDLIKQILQDITPFQSKVTLKVSQGSRKYLSKKARQRLHKAQNDATNLAQTHSKSFQPNNSKIIYTDNGNENLCSRALSCLNQIILCCGCFLKPVLHKILQENIVSLCIETAGTVEPKSNLYHASKCRANLYFILHSLIISPHHLCPPPVQYAATVFSIVQNTDSDRNIREQCANHLRSIEKILHPQKEVFYFETEAGEYWKHIDEKNPANLEECDESDEEQDVEMQVNTSAEEVTESIIVTTTTKEVCNGITLKQTEVTTENVITISKPADPDVLSVSDNENVSENATDTPENLTSPKRPHQSLDPDAAERLTPPRKSFRLSLAQNSGSGSDQDSLDKPASDTPRRRSARLNSFSSSQATPKKADEKTTGGSQRLENIKEDESERKRKDSTTTTQISGSHNSDEKNVNKSIVSNVKYIDDCVEEMLSEFVGEFLPDTNDNSD